MTSDFKIFLAMLLVEFWCIAGLAANLSFLKRKISTFLQWLVFIVAYWRRVEP